MVGDEIKDTLVEVTEEYLKDRLYIIRGKRVMLDADLAEIYGYTTKRLNEQVKRNISKFPEDFMFQTSDEEKDDLRSQIATANTNSMSRSNPYVFTEQGLYMLMTVLSGKLAEKQSIALVRTFKKMKDYIIENQGLIGEREYLQLSMRVSDNFKHTLDIRQDLTEVEDEVAQIVDKLSDVVYKSEIADILTKFGNPQIKRDYILLNNQPFKADLALYEIYSYAKKRIDIVDNYISIKTLEHLIQCAPEISITIYSDNINNGLRASAFLDFCKEYPKLKVELKKTCGHFHDRYIVLDYGTDDERFFLCGGSSKDAGSRITTISEIMTKNLFRSVASELYDNPVLLLT